MSTSLLDHLRTERGAILLSDLLRDIRVLRGLEGFPRSPVEMRAQLAALAEKGLAECELLDGDELWWCLPERLPVGPQERQGSLFG